MSSKGQSEQTRCAGEIVIQDTDTGTVGDWNRGTSSGSGETACVYKVYLCMCVCVCVVVGY